MNERDSEYRSKVFANFLQAVAVAAVINVEWTRYVRGLLWFSGKQKRLFVINFSFQI